MLGAVESVLTLLNKNVHTIVKSVLKYLTKLLMFLQYSTVSGPLLLICTLLLDKFG